MPTLFARTAGATAVYYGGYLTKNSCELPGRWTGKQAPPLERFGPAVIAAAAELSRTLGG